MGTIISILFWGCFIICMFMDTMGGHGKKTVYSRGKKYTVDETPFLDTFGAIVIIAYFIYLFVKLIVENS